MKKKFLGFLSFSFICGFLALGNLDSNVNSALADTHTHNYVNGVCECGTRVFECEDGLIEGEMTSTDPNDKFINDFSSSDNPDHPVSGSGFVEYMAHYGNKITWKFSLNEKLENVKCHLWISTGQDSKSTSPICVYNNGVKSKWESKTVHYQGPDIWYYFEDCVFYANFAKGNNTLVMVNESGFSYNFDSLEAEFPKTVVYGAYIDGDPDGEMPDKAPWGTGDPEQDVEKALDPVSSKGSIIMEAEYCHQIVGTNGSGEETWFANDDNASGGGVITNFAYVGDNVASWKFYCDKPVKAATISIMMSTRAYGVEWAQIFIPRINGGSGGATPFDQSRWGSTFGIDIGSAGINSEHDSLDDYFIFTIGETVELKEGENIFEMEAWQGQIFNMDYVEFSTSEDVTFTYTPISRGYGGKGGPTSVEAETAQIKATSSDKENKELILEVAATEGRETSGGKAVGNFAVENNKIIFAFRSNLALGNIKLSLFVAPRGEGGSTKDIISISVNGENKNLDQANFPSGNATSVVWNELTMNVEIKSGLNKVTLTNIKGEDFLVDNIYLDVPQNCTISTKNLDKSAPTISAIRITTIGIRTQKELEFTFSVSDDFADDDEIKITISIYYNFGKKDQSKVGVLEGNKFIADYKGDYTISVTATDASNHSATQKRIVRVKYGEDKKEVVVHVVDGKLVGGWITFGIGMAAAAALIAYMIVTEKKKA